MGNKSSVTNKELTENSPSDVRECSTSDPWWPKNIRGDSVKRASKISNSSSSYSSNSVKESIHEDIDLTQFREELRKKRETRQSTMADLRRKMDDLRSGLDNEKAKNEKLINFIRKTHKGDSEKILNMILNDGVVIIQDKVDPPDGETKECNEPSSVLAESAGNKEGNNIAADRCIELRKNLSEAQLQLQDANAEILSLDTIVTGLRLEIQTLKDEIRRDKATEGSEIITLRKSLAESQYHLQLANAEILSLETDVSKVKNQVQALKDVVAASKEMLKIKEEQVDQLKNKLKEIEGSLQEREMKIMSEQLKQEYDRQLINIRNLRELYEERERVSRLERDNLLRQLDVKKSDLEVEIEKSKNLEAHVLNLQNDVTMAKDEVSDTKEKLSAAIAETKQLNAEMSVVNQFISKILLGVNKNDKMNEINIDKLTEVLEDNRELLTEITKNQAETIENASFLPKLLYDLVTQIDATEMQPLQTVQTSVEEIAEKLPKVWRVLIELLHHQKSDQVPFMENGLGEDCYKTVETVNGPTNVLSVSKTYIKLKDLIMEKKSLRKETDRLKTLNHHLEKRLESQEKRLSAVSLELTKTWHLVGRMQRQHRQLHTQEQILRYHLQQKRRLISEIKEELEYCRKKWSAARQKNNDTETQWKILKLEFANRKKQDALNTSAESGYSDEQQSDDYDEEEDSKNNSNHLKRVHSLTDRETLDTIVSFQRQRSHSEPDITLLNELKTFIVVDISHSGAATAGPSKVSSIKKTKKKKKKSPETAEQMFNRLMDPNYVEDDEDDEYVDDDDNDEDNTIDKSSGSPTSIEKLIIVAEPKLTSEQIFNEKRNARLKRMEELNSKIDTYDSKKQNEPTSASVDQDENVAGPSSKCLSSAEEEALLKRAARLERLEKEAKEFYNKLSKTVNRGTKISAQIDDIHNGFVSRQADSAVPVLSVSTTASSPSSSTTAQASIQRDNKHLTEHEIDYTNRRAERLNRLETQSQSLLDKMNKTSDRASDLIKKLDDLHSKFSTDSKIVDDPAHINEGGSNEILFQEPPIVMEVQELEQLPNEVVNTITEETDNSSYNNIIEIENEIASLIDFELEITNENSDDSDDE